MSISNRQIGYIKGLGRKHGIEYSRDELEGMTYKDADALIKSLKSDEDKEAEESLLKQKKKILSMCHTMKWEIDGKVDFEKLDKWCVTYSYLHKSFDNYKAHEINKLVSQIQYGLLKSELAKNA